MSAYSQPTAVTLRTRVGNTVYVNSSSQTLNAATGPIPAGALVVAVVFAGPFTQDGAGNFSNTIGIPRFWNGVNQGNMTMVQTAMDHPVLGESVAQSQFAVAYRFVPNNGLGGDPNFAVQVDAFAGPGLNQFTSLQVAVFDGADNNGTILTNHSDYGLDGGGNSPTVAPLPQVSNSLPGVLLGVWCGQDAGNYSTNEYGAGAGPFYTLQADGNVPFELYGGSVLVDAAAGTTPALNATQIGTYPYGGITFNRMRSAAVFIPIKKIDAVGDLATEGY